MADLKTCAMCEQAFTDFKSLGKHLRLEEKITQTKYIEAYIDKRDRWSGDKIPFKNFGQYDEADFVSRENFRKWVVKRASTEEAKNYCFSFLRKRIKSRGLHYTPTHVELRAINCLSIVGFESILADGIEGYQQFCKGMGLEKRFDYGERQGAPYIEDMKIYVDTREQNPLTFPCSIEVRTLNVGDYSCADPYYSDLVVERKSLEDFVGTMGKGNERFKKEIERAREQNIYLVIVVEEKFDTALNYHGKNSKQKLGGPSPFGIVRKLLQEYKNIQFLFANDRAGSADKIRRIFSIGDSMKTTDLQYLHDKGEI
jgi:hypothetical protein